MAGSCRLASVEARIGPWPLELRDDGLTATKRMAWVGALGTMVLAQAAWAAHPLQTEDTGTQGPGNLEFENGFDLARAGAARSWVYQPQLSYGVGSTLDLIVQPSWLRNRDRSGTTRRGLGDTNLDLKWRFYGDDPISFGIRAGLALPTGERGLGLPQGRVAPHLMLVTTWDAAPFTVHGNLGVVRNSGAAGQRSSLARASAALTWAANEQWTWVLDGEVQASPDASRRSWPGTVLAAAIYTVRSGLDLDLGRQASVGGPVSARNWLFGLTYRFAP